jgi:hypothetical protein
VNRKQLSPNSLHSIPFIGHPIHPTACSTVSALALFSENSFPNALSDPSDDPPQLHRQYAHSSSRTPHDNKLVLFVKLLASP